MKKEWVAPMSREVRAAINRVLAERPGIGGAPLFPSGEDPAKPVRTEVASAWLPRAEKLAGLPKQEGSLWHAFRRKWATERKHLPAPDVAAAGGWSDLNTLLTVYQQPDAETMFRVVAEPAKLVERASGV
jgi:integrase